MGQHELLLMMYRPLWTRVYDCSSGAWTLCRFVGIDGIDGNQVPLPNVLVNHLTEEEVLGNGASTILLQL